MCTTSDLISSASGANQHYEISKRSHVLVVSHGKAYSRVEVYPTFSIKIGCAFDYSAYPYDEQVPSYTLIQYYYLLELSTRHLCDKANDRNRVDRLLRSPSISVTR